MYFAAITRLKRWARLLEAQAQRNYITGPHFRDAIAEARGLAARGYRISLGYWNGVGESSARVADAYRQALDGSSGIGASARVSIKAPAMGYGVGEFENLAALSQARGVPLHFDSLRPQDADRILELAARLPAEEVGCTLPARWQRSLADAEWAAARGLVVRVVKGQWDDVHPMDPEAVAPRYLDIIERLAGRARRVLVATHDERLAARALDRLLSTGTPCELEVLHGLPVRHLLPAAFARRVPVRVYLPYGKAWLPYRLSAARRNPRVLIWLLKDLLGRPAAPRFPVYPAPEPRTCGCAGNCGRMP